ncbi:hypothetical protein [Maliponia aquimaris]|uniref:Uncharacterized protein n=1 Tax=Maliponia aquimaris TaxID=1673631 RepID=A0A238JSE9_9RHOB|nr:hypothetical protein [Maliponia aquimaris]SMX33393.1 hypothetical protein MAA8898_00456 [Maliponia aquimaris]
MIPALPYRELSLHWQGQPLALRYTSVWFAAGNYRAAHLEIRCASPLPFTQTGYSSDFLRNPPEEFDPLAFVAAWLEDAAGDPAWQAQQERDRQGCLF